MNEPPARVLVVDDEPLFLELLSEALRRRAYRVATCTGPDQAIAIATREGFDIAILDVDLRAHLNGIELAGRLRELEPGTPIVFLTMLIDAGFMSSQSAAGLEGSSYLLKSGLADISELTDAVEAALHGETYVSPEVMGLAEKNTLGLTPNQLELVRLMARGKSNQAIATEMGISSSAVEKSVRRICRTLQISPAPDINPRVACVSAYLQSALRG